MKNNTNTNLKIELHLKETNNIQLLEINRSRQTHIVSFQIMEKVKKEKKKKNNTEMNYNIYYMLPC